MTLEEALACIGPLVGDGGVDRRREEAAAIVAAETEKAVAAEQRKFGDAVDGGLANEACSVILFRLMKRAIKAPQARGEAIAAGRGFLRTMARNWFIDELRKRKRFVPLLDGDGEGHGAQTRHGDGPLDPDAQGAAQARGEGGTPLHLSAEELLVWEEQRAREQAVQVRCDAFLRGPLVEHAVRSARGAGPQQGVRETLEALFALAEGRQTMEALLAGRRREEGVAEGSEDDKRLRNGLDQQFSRVRKRLLDALCALPAPPDFGAEEREYLRGRIDLLRLRPGAGGAQAPVARELSDK